jgi:hypothetical protein
MHKNNMTIETRNPKNGKKPGGKNLKKTQKNSKKTPTRICQFYKNGVSWRCIADQ